MNDLIERQSVLNACEQSINILEAVDRIMDLPSVEQEPCGDAISRADVRHLIAEVKRKSLYSISSKAFEELYNGIDNLPPILPPVNPQPCEDAISRQATIEAFQMFRGYEANRTNAEWVDRIETVVEKLPPVNPQKIGHWIEKYTEDGCGELYSYWACSECGRSVGFNLANIEDVLSDYPYCHCGARMVESQESEVNNG